MSRPAETGGAADAMVTLVADDGFPLAATRFRAHGPRRGVVVIAPATGLPQRYYRPFARHLAADGWDVLTWDWRGVADSRHGVSTRDRRLTMKAWGEFDLSAAIGWADRRAKGDPVTLVGHCFGAQAVGQASNADLLSAATMVAGQHPWLGHRAGQGWWSQASSLYLSVPILTRLLGRYPGARFGAGADLPAGVAREWASWCRSRDAHGDWSGHRRLRFPIQSFSFDDDPVAPLSAVEGLLEKFTSATSIDHRHIMPAELGVDQVGHFGFFTEGWVPSLWMEVTEFLAQSTAVPVAR